MIATAVVTASALVPAVAILEGSTRQPAAPKLQDQYGAQRCTGPAGSGPCVVELNSGTPLGISQR